MDLRGVLACGQLIKKFLVLTGNALPVIQSAYAVRRAAAVVLCQFRLFFYQLDFPGEIIGILKQYSVWPQHLSIERVRMSENQIAISQRFQQCRIGPAHHVPMNVSVSIAVEFLYMLDAVHVSEEADAITGIALEIADPLAAVIRISGNGQDAVGSRLLESFHDQRSIVFRDQAAGDEVIASGLQPVLLQHFRMGGYLDVAAVSDTC